MYTCIIPTLFLTRASQFVRQLCMNALFEELQRTKNVLKTIGQGGMED